MKIHRFIDNFDLTKKELEISGEIAHQIIKVLKLKVGEKIEICDKKGTYAIAKIVKIEKNTVLIEINELIKNQNTDKHINLFCAILKKENFELVVQKATECGVSKIIPVITARTIKTGLNMERLQKIAKEASEQSGRVNVPEILEPIKFNDISETKIEDSINIVFDISGESLFEMHKNFQQKIFSVHRRHDSQGISNNDSPSINIFIGPEGGWTEEEIEKANSSNFKIASLGSLTLRGETAAIIATYLISNLC